MKKALLSLLLFGCIPFAKPTTTLTVEKQEVVKYKIRIDFFISKDDIKNFPLLRRSLRNALIKWDQILPIEIVIKIGNKKPYNAILIDFSDKEQKTQLGTWDWQNNILTIYSSQIRDNEKLAYSVCLHELGHIFGLPHMVNHGDYNAGSGDLIVENAEQYLMYPKMTNDPVIELSELEKEIALNYTKNLLSQKLIGKISCQR